MLSVSSSASTVTTSVEETWQSFKQKKTAVDLYAEDAVIMYVSSNRGVRGNAQIRKFYLHPQFNEKNNSVQEVVVSTLIAGRKLMEEAIWTVHCYSGECKWLVPNIEDRFLMNATINFPVFTSVSFDKDFKIESIRYNWDQASVLKQLKVISEKVQWPVIADQVDTLISPHKVQLIGLNDEPIHIDHQKTQKEQEKNQFPTGRIFGPVDPKDQVRQPIRRAEPTAPASRNIFTYEPPAQKPLVAPSNKLTSSFSFSHDEGTKKLSTSKSASTAGKHFTPVSRNIFG